MPRPLCMRILALLSLPVLIGSLTGCDATGSVGVRFLGEVSVDPDRVPADGRMGAEVSVLVFRDNGARTPMQGIEVEVTSSRNAGGVVVDLIEQPTLPTDADGRAVAFVGSETQGLAHLLARANGEPLCTAGHGASCEAAMVDLTFLADCPPGQTDCGAGCVDLASSVEHCGGCGEPCAFDHASATCVQSACVMGTCEAGWGDCDQNAETGCEQDVFGSVEHCGSCNRPCAEGEICTDGACAIPCDDLDGDGFEDVACGGTDCDDANQFVNPDVTENCNDAVDNDCNGQTDAEDMACWTCVDDADCADGDACNGDEVCLDGACGAGQALDCDDGNSCTNDACDPINGCAHVNNTSMCNDGDPCTMIDFCASGVCAGIPLDADQDGHVASDCGGTDCNDTNPLVNPDMFEGVTGTCADGVDNDCDGNLDGDDTGCQACTVAGDCDDNNACNGSETCLDSACQPGQPLTCDDANPCTSDSCDPVSGCVNAANSLPCDDGDRCTVDDFCDSGQCQSGYARNCDDADPCTDDSCDSANGCQYANNSGPCDDGDACTAGDLCLSGACYPGTPADCNDNNACTVDSCDPAVGCLNVNTTDPCSDGNACTVGDVCAAGACVSGAARVCDDANLCTDDTCDPALGCVVTNNTATCSDNNACTDGDVCGGGACQPGAPLGCDDGNPCTEDSCDVAIGCVHTPNAISCDDGDACTENDYCSEGSCFSGTPLACGDGNPCTDDSCDPASGCVNQNNTAACSDDNACTTGDVCAGGSCQAGAPRVCNDGNVCTNDSCNPATGCVVSNNTAPCDDANACTVNDSCGGGSCQPGAPLACGDGNPCTDDSCNPASGCVHADNTAPCSDGDACTNGDVCAGGACTSGAPLVCDDGNICTNDSCNPATGCVVANNTAPCDDGNACTLNDACAGGSCQAGAPRVCNDGNICTDDSCNPASGCVVVNNSAPCSDGSACTVSDQCNGGACVPGAPPNCNDGNVCTDDSCDPALGCRNLANANPCDDSDACTMNDVCTASVCGGEPLDGDGDGYVAAACSGNDCNDGEPLVNPGIFEGPAGNARCSDGIDNDCDGATDLAEDSCGNCNNNGDCDDGDPCNGAETCDGGGNCLAGTALNCNDGNPCTNDSCQAMVGCQNLNNTAPCDDGNACTSGDTCGGGACNSGSPVVCNDGNLCTDDSCDTILGCVAANNTASCDDGNACTINDACAGGSCVGGGSLACSDGDVCTDDACNPASGCYYVDNTAPCNDGNACTVNDACASGSCVGGGPLSCNDGNVCTTDSCNPASGCQYVANSNSCDDGNACTVSDQCSGGTCQPGGPRNCNDGEPCTDDSCNPASGCVNTNNTVACNDGNACTENDQCAGGSCQPGPALNCDDGDVCTDDGCNILSGCVYSDNTAACEDGNACTINDACSAGACLPGGPLSCSDTNPCTTDSCNPASGCTYANNTAACSDGNPCTLGDVCSGGSCQPGTPDPCGDGNPCTDDSCNPASGCQHVNDDSNVCDDGDPCTDNDFCSAGVCDASSLRDRDGDNYEDGLCGGDDCDDLNGNIHPGATEVCDGADNNCDSLIDQRLCAIQEGACAGTLQQCVSGAWASCNYAARPNYQHVETLCDGIDNDCDGCTDEGCAGYGNPVVAVDVIPYSSGNGFRRLMGNGQSGPVGTLLPVPLTVQLNNGSGVPQANQLVQFTVAPANGVCYGQGGTHATGNGLGNLNIALVCNDVASSTLVGPTSVYTDENGQASVQLRLSASASGMSAVTATAVSSGAQLHFFASSSAALLDTITLTSGASATANPAVGPLNVTRRPSGGSQAYMETETNYQLLITGLAADTDAGGVEVPQAPLQAGGTLTITGMRFSNSGNQVWVGGTLATITFQSATEIRVAIPEGIPGAASVMVDDGTQTPFAGGVGNIPSFAVAPAAFWRVAPKPVYIFADTGNQSGSSAQVKVLGLDVCGNPIDISAPAKTVAAYNPNTSSASSAVAVAWVNQGQGIAQVTNVDDTVRSAEIVATVGALSSDDTVGGNLTATTVPRAYAPDVFGEDPGLANDDGINSILFRGGTNDDGITTDDWTFNPAVRFSWVDMDAYSVPDGSGASFEHEAHMFVATMIGEGDITYVPGSQRTAAMAGTGLAVHSGGPDGLTATVSAEAAYHMRVCILFWCQNIDGNMAVEGIVLPGFFREVAGEQQVELNTSGLTEYDAAHAEWRNLIMRLFILRSLP